MSSFGRRGLSLPPAGRGGPTDAGRPRTRLLSFEQATAQVVATLQDQLPMGLWAVTRRDGDEQVFVEVTGTEYDITSGHTAAWEGSLCQAMLEGAPALTTDASTVSHYQGTGPVTEWPVRTYLASPIATPDGGVYGTLCGYAPGAGDLAALQAMAPVVALLADLLGQVLVSERLRAEADDREAHLYEMATRDHLTGLATRAVLHDRLAHALDLHRTGHQQPGGRPLTLLLIDVDDFKTVNDTHGHAAGDALLAHLGRTWQSHVSLGNTLARIGGDEFALLIETGRSLEDVLAEVRAGLSSPLTVPDTPMLVSASVGLAHLEPTDPTPTPAELLARADRALYATKRNGKAGLTVADPTP